MALFPTPITRENFPKAWRYVTRKYRHSNVKLAIRKVALPFGQILFFPIFLILALGTVYTATPAPISGIIDRFPVLVQLWNSIAQPLFADAQGLGECLLRAAAFAYGIPFAVYLVVAAIIFIVYHPKAPAMGGDDLLNAETLWSMARHSQMNTRIKGKDIPGFLATVTGILAAAFVAFVIFFWLIPGEGDLLADVSLAGKLKLFALALILIFSYGVVYLPLAGLMKLIYHCRISGNAVRSAEIYCRSLRKAPMQVDMSPIITTPTANPAEPIPVDPIPAAEDVPEIQ